MNMPEKLSFFCTESAHAHGIIVREYAHRSTAGWIVATWSRW